VSEPCAKCGGKGFLYELSLLDGGRYCDCALLQLRLANMDRIWKSLSKAKTTPELVKKPRLLPFVGQNLYITASTASFRAHFKALCLHRSTVWDARVRTDADLLDSWLGTTKLAGNRIYDVEIAEQTSLKALDLPSLLSNFPLVVLVLGVKRLPNRESANALLEAINYRAHEELPIWIVDQADHPITEITHQFYSDYLVELLAEWKHLSLDGSTTTFPRSPEASPSVLDAVLADLGSTYGTTTPESARAPEEPSEDPPPKKTKRIISDPAPGNEIPGLRMSKPYKKKSRL